MQDAQTPQQALDTARTATRQAHDAAAPPGWVPIAAGVLFGLTAVLISTAFDDRTSTPVVWAGVFAFGSVSVALGWWVSRMARARGIVPRPWALQPVAEWKQILLLVLQPLPVGALTALGVDNVWWRLAAGVAAGGWIWFGLSRQWPARWKK